MKKFKLGVLVTLIVFVLSASHFASAFKLNLDPPRVSLVLKQGDESGGYIALSSSNEKPMHVKCYVNDLVYLPDGSNDFLPPGSTPWSCAEWIKISPTEFEIPPGQEGRLRYVVSVPKDATGGRYGVVFFEITPPLEQLKSSGANVNVRIGSIILVDVDGTQLRKAELTGMEVNPVKDKPNEIEIACTVANQGNVILRPNGPIKIIDNAKNEIAEVKLNPDKTGVFPQTGRTFYVKYNKEKLAKGEYYLQAVLDYGGDSYLGGQKKFEVQ